LKFRFVAVMSALPPKADIAGLQFDVRFVQKRTALQQTLPYSGKSTTSDWADAELPLSARVGLTAHQPSDSTGFISL
jgi:hypothetical protein